MAPSHGQCGGKEDKRSENSTAESFKSGSLMWWLSRRRYGATRSPQNFLVSYWEDSCIMVYRNSLLTVVAVEEVCNVTGSLRKGGEPDKSKESLISFKVQKKWTPKRVRVERQANLWMWQFLRQTPHIGSTWWPFRQVVVRLKRRAVGETELEFNTRAWALLWLWAEKLLVYRESCRGTLSVESRVLLSREN